MKLLLDSHVLLWWAMGSSRLGRTAAQVLTDDDAAPLISAASWWELGLKCALGKLEADLELVRETLLGRGVGMITVTMAHAEAAAKLPILHRDPFDHMLVAQALVEKCRLVTRDKALAAYGGAVLLV